MELVVGASEATMRSLLGKLGALLAQEYSLIRGVHGDLQYINDELASMQSFLRDLSAVGDARGQGHDHRMKDWMKQIRDITYDIEDCVDDSAHRLHGLRTDMCCYFLVNSVYEILTWGPRRDISTKISNLKLRAQQIGERRHRYGVDNPNSLTTKASPLGASTTGFDAADNQDANLQIVTIKDPVGVEKDMGELEKWLINEETNRRVLSIVGFGGVGKTTIATALYRKFGNKFDRRAMVTVSQSSDLEAILTNIKSQVMQQSSRHDQQGGSEEKSLAAAVKGVLGRVSRGTSAVMAKCDIAGTSEERQGNTKLDQLKEDLKKNLKENRCCTSNPYSFSEWLIHVLPLRKQANASEASTLTPPCSPDRGSSCSASAPPTAQPTQLLACSLHRLSVSPSDEGFSGRRCLSNSPTWFMLA